MGTPTFTVILPYLPSPVATVSGCPRLSRNVLISRALPESRKHVGVCQIMP